MVADITIFDLRLMRPVPQMQKRTMAAESLVICGISLDFKRRVNASRTS